MRNEPRRLHTMRFMLDTNRINARQLDTSVNQLESWRENGVIELVMPEPACNEARSGGYAARTSKAEQYIYAMPLPTTSVDQTQQAAISSILCPSGPTSPSARDDVDIVFCAQQYGAMLVNEDGASKRQPGGILGNRGELRKLGIIALRTEEALAMVREEIAKRDERARRLAEATGESVPCWVGLD